MGLDMHLTGQIYIMPDWDNPTNDQYEDGFRVKGRTLDLGYWRKHPDLHGFIVEEFAEGTDDCKPVYLDQDDIALIIAAIRDGNLPKTKGFFFGESENDETQVAEGIAIFSKVLAWLQGDDFLRSVYYQASW